MEKAQTPADCDRLFAHYVKAGDLDALVALYEPDARLVHQDGTVAIGREQIADSLRPLTNVRADMRMNVVKSIAYGDVAIQYNEWTLTIPNAEGRLNESRGMAVECLRRQADGGWLYAIDDPFAKS